MEVSEKRAKLWINQHERPDGSVWHDYSIGISSKRQDGSWANTSIKAAFSKKVELPAALANGAFIGIHGFMTVHEYTRKDGTKVTQPMIMITHAKFDGDEEPVGDIAGPANSPVDWDFGFAEVDDDEIVPF